MSYARAGSSPALGTTLKTGLFMGSVSFRKPRIAGLLCFLPASSRLLGQFYIRPPPSSSRQRATPAVPKATNVQSYSLLQHSFEESGVSRNHFTNVSGMCGLSDYFYPSLALRTYLWFVVGSMRIWRSCRYMFLYVSLRAPHI